MINKYSIFSKFSVNSLMGNSMNHVSKGKVIDIIKHKQNLREYIIEVEKTRKYAPGSFVQFTLDDVTASDIWPDSRTFSIASYNNGYMRFIIKNVGMYTDRIFDKLKVNTECTIKCPFGDLFDASSSRRTACFYCWWSWPYSISGSY